MDLLTNISPILQFNLIGGALLALFAGFIMLHAVISSKQFNRKYGTERPVYTVIREKETISGYIVRVIAFIGTSDAYFYASSPNEQDDIIAELKKKHRITVVNKL